MYCFYFNMITIYFCIVIIYFCIKIIKIMLKYNIKRILGIRNITKPVNFFISCGLSPGTASKYANSELTTLNLRTVETVCQKLHCTPNDLLEWQPDKDEDNRSDHPLYPLKKSEKEMQIARLIQSIPINKINELEEVLKNLRK